jgi:chromosomal replication initiator protein
MADEYNATDARNAHDNREESNAGRMEVSSAGPDRTAGRIAEALQRRIGPERYGAWFGSGSATLRVVGDRLCVDSQNQFVADWIGRHFAGELRTVAREALGDGVRVDVTVVPARSPSRPGADANGVRATSSTDLKPPKRKRRHDREDAPERRDESTLFTPPLPPRVALRSLSDFVVGPSNRLAFTAADRLANNDARGDTSALLIYGECGVGKTHLLQGICARYNERRRRANAARYLTAERFTNEYITAIRTHTLEQFRNEYRRVELLAIDDVHFLSSKTGTQNEFLHTMDALDLSGARLVLASDQHPRMIPQLDPSLVNRLVARLVVRIDPPDPETRLAIVRHLAQRRGLNLLEAAAESVAARCLGSVREIEGALAQLSALAHATPEAGHGGAIGTILVDQLFRQHDPVLRTGPVRLSSIVDHVCARLSIDRADLFSRSRHRRIVLARGLITHLARTLTSHSYPEIAAALGRACHSTVHAADRRIESLLAASANDERPVAGSEHVPRNASYTPAEVRLYFEELRARIVRAPAGLPNE